MDEEVTRKKNKKVKRMKVLRCIENFMEIICLLTAEVILRVKLFIYFFNLMDHL